MTKKNQIVLVFVGSYFPGFKAGGLVRAIKNTVIHLKRDFDFKIITRDRDVGDTFPYQNILRAKWVDGDSESIYYIPKEKQSIISLMRIINKVSSDVIYLNSFFDPISIKIILLLKLNLVPTRKAVVAPRGEFEWPSLKQKYFKKYIYMLFAKYFKLYKNIVWHASCEQESFDIFKYMQRDGGPIQIETVADLPPDLSIIQEKYCSVPGTENYGRLKIIFLSRISPEKNLDIALRILGNLTECVDFDIYGPAENTKYWERCQNLIAKLPSNIVVNYRGSVPAERVTQIFEGYDLFLFPTGGEAWGHVIAESLIAGTPVLVSKNTPWTKLEELGFGWDIDLGDIHKFASTISNFSKITITERLKIRKLIQAKIGVYLLNPEILEKNKNLLSA